MLTFQSGLLLTRIGILHSRDTTRKLRRRYCRSSNKRIDESVTEHTNQHHDQKDPVEAQHESRVYFMSSAVVDSVQPIQYPVWYGHHGNLILAIVIILAVKLGRNAADQHQLDTYGTQTLTDGLIGVSKELAARRKHQQEMEILMKEKEAKQRMENALQKAKEENAKRKERERRYQAEQEMEVKRLQAEQQRKKEAFEAQEKRMQTELEKRMEVEMRIQQELEQKRKAEEAEQKRIAAEQRSLELERKAAEEAEQQRQLMLQKQKEEEERRALDLIKTKFALRVECELTLNRSASGVKTTKPPSQQALVSVELKMKPSISETFTNFDDHFSDIEDARDSIGRLIGFVCRGTIDDYLSNIRLQSMQGSGPLMLMDEKELELFASFAAVHTHYKTEKSAQCLLDDFERSNSIGSFGDRLQVRTEWGVLPQDHEKGLNLTIESILKQSAEVGVHKAKTKEALEKLIESELINLSNKHEENMEFQESTTACYLSYIHNRALDLKDDRLYEALVPLLQELMETQCNQSKPDTLQCQSTALSSALGEGNPVSEWFWVLAEKNMSSAKRQAALEKQQRLAAINRARILQEQWPDRSQITAELIKEREEKTPIPERVWAMKNVAKTLLIGSPSASALTKARDLLTQAIDLQKQYFKFPVHPGLLGALKDSAEIEAKIDEEKAGALWEEIVLILSELCDRYRKQGELYSAALCAETAVLNGEVFLDVRHPLINKLGKASEALFNVLNDREKSKILELRKSGKGLNVITESFATQLGVYRVPGKVDRDRRSAHLCATELQDFELVVPEPPLDQDSRSLDSADVVIIGSGVGGLSCGALLAHYGVIVLESHYRAGGAAHCWQARTKSGMYTFESGPSLYSGMKSRGTDANPLGSVFHAIKEELDLVEYNSWNIYFPEGQWNAKVGKGEFLKILNDVKGPDSQAVREWKKLEEFMKEYAPVVGSIPPIAFRDDPGALLTVLGRYFPSIFKHGLKSSQLFVPFSKLIEGVVSDEFIKDYLDLLSFLLSGLPANGTIAAEMAVMFNEWYKPDCCLEYPRGGSQAVVDTLIKSIEKNGGRVLVKSHVDEILIQNGVAVGVQLKNGRKIKAKKAVVSNAALQQTAKLIKDENCIKEFQKREEEIPLNPSFMHLHLGFDATDLDVDLHHIIVNQWKPSVVSEQNVVLVSIPSVVDPEFAPTGKHSLHAYLPATEPYEIWKGLDPKSEKYRKLKTERSEVLWKGVERIVPDIRERTEISFVGTPLTHERFLRRYHGSYGPAVIAGQGILPSHGSTVKGLYCCGDFTFPGIGLPAVAASGAITANSLVSVWDHMKLLTEMGL
eukprot:g5499.t1